MSTEPTVPGPSRSVPPAARKGLVLELAELFVLPRHHRRQDLAMFETLMLSLYSDAPLDERQRAAALLASRKDLPSSVAALMAAEEIAVAAPVLSACQTLATIDRIRIIANRSESHRKILAARSDLDEATISALLVHGGPETIEVLGTNQSLQLTSAQMNDLLARGTADSRPMTSHGRMVNQGFGQSIDRFFDLDRDARRRVLAAFEAETAFRRIGKYGRRTPPAMANGLSQRLIDAVFSGEREHYERLLGESLGVDNDLAGRIVADRGGEALVVALVALGIDASDATSIFVRSDPSLGWTYQTIRHLVQLYSLVGWRTAEAVIARWSGAANAGPKGTIRVTDATRADRPQNRQGRAATTPTQSTTRRTTS